MKKKDKRDYDFIISENIHVFIPQNNGDYDYSLKEYSRLFYLRIMEIMTIISKNIQVFFPQNNGDYDYNHTEYFIFS